MMTHDDLSLYRGTAGTQCLRRRLQSAMNSSCDMCMDTREVADLVLAMEERDALAAQLEWIAEIWSRCAAMPSITEQLEIDVALDSRSRPSLAARDAALLRWAGGKMLFDSASRHLYELADGIERGSDGKE